MEGKHPVWKLLLVLVVLCAGLPLQRPGAALAAGSATFSQADAATNEGQATLESLLAKARSAGSLLVLVELALPQPFTAEGEASLAAALDQRAAIAAASDALLAALAGTETQVAATFTTIPYVALRVNAEALATLASLPQVASLQEDIPAAPALDSSAQLIGLPAVWASGVEGQGQTVVILDTGIDTDHPFFAGRLVDGACFSNANGASTRISACPDGSNTQYGVAAAESDISNTACWNGASSLCNHGSHVAGIAAGGSSGSLSGAARRANLIAIQVYTRFTNYPNCGGSGSCMLSFITDQMRALDYIYTTLRPAHTLAAVNMSLGSGQYSGACDYDGRKPAIDNLRAAGIATVVAAGNNSFRNGLTSPACITSAVAVGGVTDGGNPPADAVLYNLHSLVDLLAPAYSVTSAVIGGGYGGMSGTSMAAPFVAGAFALCKSAYPSLSINQIETILEQTGVAVRDGRSGGVYTNVEVRSLLLEPGAQASIAGGALTLHGSLEALGAAQLNTANSTLVLAGEQLAGLALPSGQTLHNLQVGNGSDPFQAALDSDLALSGDLVVQPGATLDLAGAALTVEGTVVNRGALRQSRPATSGVVEFLRIKNAAGNGTRYWGVDIAPTADMGYTAVTVEGDQICQQGGADVRRCYEITPATARPSQLTLYYSAAEANGVANPSGYHWNGTAWEGPLPGSSGVNGPIQFTTVEGVSSYSTFAVRDGAPLAVLLASLTAEARPGHVLLAWETTSERDNLGFTVLRSAAPDAAPEWMAWLPSPAPGSTQGHSYGWQDFKVEAGNSYWYWIEDVDFAGNTRRHGPVRVLYALRDR